ncbi:putative ABC transporter permease ybbP [Stappia sp. 22II-S9-Z10]|nr:putative ABC transporter permease ybbP [Stappia sp. 22II-S9-Z10]
MSDAVIGMASPRRRHLRAPLALRYAVRQLRGGLRGFYVFLACIILGTATIAAVNSLASGLVDGISAEGQSLLGGDLNISLMHRTAWPDELDFLNDKGAVSTVATLRAMVRRPGGRQVLVELKAVDGSYPLYGAVELAGGATLADAFRGGAQNRVPIVVDETLLTTAGLSVGDDVWIGRAEARIVAVIDREPDRISGGLAFGPRVMMPVQDLAETGLVTTGSLVRWHYRIRGEERPFTEVELKSLVDEIKQAFPSAGWRVETRLDAAPRLRASIERFAQFLTIVGLTSLAVGGIGVANSVQAYLTRKRTEIATLRSLGARRDFVTAVYLLQIGLLASIGIAGGLLLGALAPPVAAIFLDGILPVSALWTIFPGALGLAALFGALTALTLAVLPLGRAGNVRPIALLRGNQDQEGGRGVPVRFLVAALACGLILTILVVATSYDRWLASIYLVGAAATFGLFHLVARGFMALGRALPRSRYTTIRMAVANIHRRGALTPTVTLSLGLSLTLLVALSQIDGNLRQTLTSTLPAEAPSFFFIDIQQAERDAFLSTLAEAAPGSIVQSQPMLRGRIVSINDVRAEDWPDTEASWVLRGDRGITYSAEPPPDSRIITGEWWAADTADRQVSFASDLANELGVRVGDRIRVNVLGREVEAQVANLRTVDWESLSINFVMIFSPNVFEGAPHAHLATLAFDGGGSDVAELALLREVTERFPTVTSIRVKDALSAVNNIVSDLVFAVRVAASITLLASMLVLAGTLAASHRSRIYDAVILKTLGAKRVTLLTAYALEYALLGVGAAAFALIAGGVAGWFIVADLMDLDFMLMPGAALAAAGGAIVVTVGLGLVGTWQALGEKPAPVLRNL